MCVRVCVSVCVLSWFFFSFFVFVCLLLLLLFWGEAGWHRLVGLFCFSSGVTDRVVEACL